MTRIDFYFNADSKLRTACRLAAKVLRQRLRVLIYAPDETIARDIDEALRAFVITSDADAAIHDEVLLNLHGEAPRFFSRFTRLVEIVGCEQDDREAARRRFRFYRDRGYEIHHHDVANERT
jgi:DNA polymerase-3 subunit chi